MQLIREASRIQLSENSCWAEVLSIRIRFRSPSLAAAAAAEEEGEVLRFLDKFVARPRRNDDGGALTIGNTVAEIDVREGAWVGTAPLGTSP